MHHQNSVFHQLLKVIPQHRFQRYVTAHGGDFRVRSLRSIGTSLWRFSTPNIAAARAFVNLRRGSTATPSGIIIWDAKALHARRFPMPMSAAP